MVKSTTIIDETRYWEYISRASFHIPIIIIEYNQTLFQKGKTNYALNFVEKSILN
jgi:hypothetical protein